MRVLLIERLMVHTMLSISTKRGIELLNINISNLYIVKIRVNRKKRAPLNR
jgi:hypothetical protein